MFLFVIVCVCFLKVNKKVGRSEDGYWAKRKCMLGKYCLKFFFFFNKKEKKSVQN